MRCYPSFFDMYLLFALVWRHQIFPEPGWNWTPGLRACSSGIHSPGEGLRADIVQPLHSTALHKMLSIALVEGQQANMGGAGTGQRVRHTLTITAELSSDLLTIRWWQLNIWSINGIINDNKGPPPLSVFLWCFLLFHFDAEILKKKRRNSIFLVFSLKSVPVTLTLEDVRRWKMLVFGQRTFLSPHFFLHPLQCVTFLVFLRVFGSVNFQQGNHLIHHYFCPYCKFWIVRIHLNLSILCYLRIRIWTEVHMCWL